LSNQFKHNQSPGITDIPSRLAANTLQPKEKSPSALSVPLRVPRELQNLRTPASSRTSSDRRSFPKLRKIGLPGLEPWPVAAATAQSDYIQNGFVLPKDPKNLKLILRDVDTKSFLDIEVAWKLRQKEGMKNVRGKIARKIQQNESAYSSEESVLRVLAE
jgi:hypothetical protein